MKQGRVKNYILMISLLFILPLALLFKTTWTKLVLAILIVILCIVISTLNKKRKVLSINKKIVTLLVGVSGFIYLMLIYLLGLKYGYYKTIYPLNINNIILYTLPSLLIIVSFEIIRYICISTECKISYYISYLSGIIIDIILFFTLGKIDNFNDLMNLMGMVIFPAITANIFYQYISSNYGYLPNVIFKILVFGYIYYMSFVPAITESIFSLINLFYPLVILFFIKILFDNRIKSVKKKEIRIFRFISVSLFILSSFIFLIFSNQIKYKAIVIATDSMTGEINRGDIVIYEEYINQEIEVGQVILFMENGNIYVHRVVDIKDVNGELYFYTKGDANESIDSGYRTKKDIVGYTDFKISYVGYLTLWLRSAVE